MKAILRLIRQITLTIVASLQPFAVSKFCKSANCEKRTQAKQICNYYGDIFCIMSYENSRSQNCVF